jgi:hypothetical protein
MSQSIDEMLASWKKSCDKPASTPLPSRFYDVRSRPTGRTRIKGHGLTPMGEAMRCRELGLDKKTAKPLPINE